jgi:hypothetical protein
VWPDFFASNFIYRRLWKVGSILPISLYDPLAMSDPITKNPVACPKCGVEMKWTESIRSKDQKSIVHSFHCSACLHRETVSEPI